MKCNIGVQYGNLPLKNIGMTTENNIPIIVKIPAKILLNNELSLNDKLILGLDYAFSLKNGSNILNHKQIGERLNLHSNIVGQSRRSLVSMGYLSKVEQTYFLTSKFEEFPITIDDIRTIYIPFEIYNHPKLRTGEKLLWGEYNSFSKGEKAYFASREHTAKRLNASKESITNWTKLLEQKQLITVRYNIRYFTNQRIITTCKFDY